MIGESKTPLEILPQWLEQYGGVPLQSSADVANDVRQMCGCLRPYPALKRHSKWYRMFCMWFMPRKVEDIEYLVMRYRVWSHLPKIMTDMLTKRKDGL